jgi:hypothetical protein
VRFANITIIEANDASQFGIGVACARITEAILGDERVVLPVAAYRERLGVTIALPTIVGSEGAHGELEPSMSDEERHAFARSAEALREVVLGDHRRVEVIRGLDLDARDQPSLGLETSPHTVQVRARDAHGQVSRPVVKKVVIRP